MKLFKNHRFQLDKGPVYALVMAVATLSSQFSSATNHQNIDDLRQSATLFLEEMTDPADKDATEVKIGYLDERLRLQQCATSPSVDFAKGSRTTGKVNLLISCLGPVAWKVHVSASIDRLGTVFVATRTLRKGTQIGPGDFEKKRVNISSLRGQPVTQQNLIQDSSVKRFLRAGSVILDNHLCLVCRGDKVTVTAKNEFFSIQLEATAISDAVKGELATVRNEASKRTFSAKVIGRNHLEALISSGN